MTFDLRTWDDPFKVEEAYDGIERRVLAFTADLMLVHYTDEDEAVFPEHEHETVQQAVFVLDGEIELEAGDSFVIGPGIRHGVRGTANVTRLVDAFTPAIAEYGSA